MQRYKYAQKDILDTVTRNVNKIIINQFEIETRTHTHTPDLKHGFDVFYFGMYRCTIFSSDNIENNIIRLLIKKFRPILQKFTTI